MDIRQLELFLAVVDNASVTRAAEKMSISPGAVSLQLHGLADELRTQLFSRAGKRLVPTPDAFRLAEHARFILREVRQIQKEFENDPSQDARPFHFAAGATTLIYRLGRPLRLLRRHYQETDMHVTVANTEEILVGLQDRSFDLGLISLPVPSENLSIIPLFEEELLLVSPSQTQVRSNTIRTIEPKQLENVPFLLPAKSNMRSIIDGYLSGLGLTPRVVMEAEDTEAIKRLVESGFGYSILPQFALRGPSKFFNTYRIAGQKLTRTQALAMARTDYPRALTLSIARFLQNALKSEEPKPASSR